ncbi:MAG: hypothetical protein WC659_02940 [Patescibacteria group bacterium]
MSKKKIILISFTVLTVIFSLSRISFSALPSDVNFFNNGDNSYESLKDCESMFIKKDECYKDIALKEENIELCQKAGERRDSCIHDLALRTKKAEYCNKLPRGCKGMFGPTCKYRCLEDLAIHAKDRSICFKNESSEHKDSCLWSYVYNTEDWEAFREFNNIDSGMYSRNYCIKTAVSQGKHSPFCNLIQGSEFLKEECRKIAGPEWTLYWLGRAIPRGLMNLAFLALFIYGFNNWKKLKYQYRGALLMILFTFPIIFLFSFLQPLNIRNDFLISTSTLLTLLTIPAAYFLMTVLQDSQTFYLIPSVLLLMIVGSLFGYVFKKSKKSIIAKIIFWLLVSLYIAGIIFNMFIAFMLMSG